MRNRIKLLSVAVLAATFTAGISFGQTTYTWNGGTDQNWSNTLNWAGGILPADDTPGAAGTNGEGITMPYADIIEFSGSTMPTSNVPGIGAFYYADASDAGNTPRMVFNSGGTMSINLVGHDNAVFQNPAGLDRIIMTVGDGSGTDDVTVNWSGGPQISRHGDGTFRYVINSDGILNRNGSFDFCRGASRIGIMTINGGTVVASGSVYDMDESPSSVIDFTALGSSFQAGWGGDFANLAAVEDAIGVQFLNTSGVAGSELVATSVGSSWKLELLSSNEVANLYTTYTWTGAVDGDWNNAANWDANGIPVDDTPDTTNSFDNGLTVHYKDSIVFDGTMLPTSNIPEIGGWYDSTAAQGDSPTMVFNSGGEIDLDVTSGQFAAFITNPQNDERSVLTVGDGVGGTDDVTVNLTVANTNNYFSSLNRHGNGTHYFQVKADGTLNIENAVTNIVDLSYNANSRPVVFLIDGGAVVINDAVRDLNGTTKVSFLSAGSSFTAKYGGQFPEITDVWASLGTAFVDLTGNTLGAIQAVDVDGTNFTVSVSSTEIQWNLPQTIVDDLDVSTEGTFEYAYNAGAASVATVNGVTFTGTGGSTAAFGSDITLTSFTGTTTDFGSISADPYASLPGNYRPLLSSAVTNGSAASAITLHNLTIGQRYQVQIWVNDSSAGNTNAQPVIASIGTGNAVTLESATAAVDGAVGQSAIGTFVADATSQTFALGGERLQLNAIQVRQVDALGVGYWTGTGGATWDAATTANFAVNEYGQALDVQTFDVAKAVNGSVTFADGYFDDETSVAVAESDITISGTVEAGKVKFINDAVVYRLGGGAIAGATAVEVSGGGTLAIDSAQSFTGGLTITEDSAVSINDGSQLGSGINTLNNGTISPDGQNHINMQGKALVLGANGGTLQNAHQRANYNVGYISGSGQLTLDGNGSTAYSGNSRIQINSITNSFTGGTLIQNKANVLVYGDGSLGATGTKVNINDGRMVFNTGMTLANREIEIAGGGGAISLNGKAVNFSGSITGSGALEINGQIRDNDGGNPSGELRVLAASTLTGDVTVREPIVVRIALDNALGTGAVTVDDGAQLKNHDSHTVLDNTVAIGTGGAEFMAGWNKSLTLNGDLSGSGAVSIPHDSGTVYLNGDGSSYTGTVTVVGGTNPSNDVTTLGGVLNLGGSLVFQTNTVLVATTANTIVLGGNLDLSGNPTLNLSGAISGPGVTIATVDGTIDGWFAGYPEGTEVQAGYAITYEDGVGVKIVPTSPFESPTVDMSIDGGVITLAWPGSIVAGDQFHVLTNVNLVHGEWGTNDTMMPVLDGDVYTVTNSIGSAPEVFYMLEAK
ncbi:hypothetical protein P4B35_06425 [Pontiellaceae bacterium B12227]|nr:hypothetical protein [Pontiellaceae bacterium B12227]